MTEQNIVSLQRFSMERGLNHVGHEKGLDSVGVYFLWDKNDLLYIGHARTAVAAKKSKMFGLRNRLDSHWYGGGTFGLALFFHRSAPIFQPEDWQRLLNGEQTYYAVNQAYIRSNVRYSYIPTKDAREAIALEKKFIKELAPKLNRVRKFQRPN